MPMCIPPMTEVTGILRTRPLSIEFAEDTSIVDYVRGRSADIPPEAAELLGNVAERDLLDALSERDKRTLVAVLYAKKIINQSSVALKMEEKKARMLVEAFLDSRYGNVPPDKLDICEFGNAGNHYVLSLAHTLEMLQSWGDFFAQRRALDFVFSRSDMLDSSTAMMLREIRIEERGPEYELDSYDDKPLFSEPSPFAYGDEPDKPDEPYAPDDEPEPKDAPHPDERPSRADEDKRGAAPESGVVPDAGIARLPRKRKRKSPVEKATPAVPAEIIRPADDGLDAETRALNTAALEEAEREAQKNMEQVG